MRRHPVLLAIPALLVALTLPARAMGLAEAFAAARSVDAKFLAAGHELEVTRQGVPIARASLRPSINVSVSDSNVTGVREFPNAIGQEVRVRTDYSAPQASLSLRAPIVNYEASTNLRRAEVLADGAESTYRIRELELVDRLGQTYFEALLAQDNVALSKVQIESLTAQLARAERRFARGEGTRTDIAQAQAALQTAKVKLVDSEDQLQFTSQTLRRMTGLPMVVLNKVVADYVPPPLLPAGVDEWLDMANRQSPLVLARQQGVEAARLSVQGRRAGHYPRLDLVGSLTRSQNESLSSLNQTSRLASVGFQLSVPLYSGGGIEAGVRQATADLARLEEEARADRENLQSDIERAHRTVSSGPARILAQRKALEASEVALVGITKALEAGLATAVDVLDAQARMDQAARDLAQSRYEYLMFRLRLLAQSGHPTSEVIDDIDRMLSVLPPLNTARNAP